jgi:tetratricopeptide (TPR) repeat protein
MKKSKVLFWGIPALLVLVCGILVGCVTTNDKAVAANRRANEARDQKNYDEAIRELKEAIRLEPDNAAWYNNLGIVYGYTREYDLQIEAYTTAIYLDPSDWYLYNNRSIAYRRHGDDVNADADVEKMKLLR